MVIEGIKSLRISHAGIDILYKDKTSAKGYVSQKELSEDIVISQVLRSTIVIGA
jgi:hypothetical protein